MPTSRRPETEEMAGTNDLCTLAKVSKAFGIRQSYVRCALFIPPTKLENGLDHAWKRIGQRSTVVANRSALAHVLGCMQSGLGLTFVAVIPTTTSTNNPAPTTSSAWSFCLSLGAGLGRCTSSFSPNVASSFELICKTFSKANGASIAQKSSPGCSKMNRRMHNIHYAMCRCFYEQ